MSGAHLNVHAALEEFVRAVVREELSQAETVSAPPAQAWFTVEEAAAYLRVSKRTLERLVASGEVRSSTTERRRIIRCAWLDEFAAAREEAEPTTSPRRRKGLRYVVPTTEHNGGST